MRRFLALTGVAVGAVTLVGPASSVVQAGAKPKLAEVTFAHGLSQVGPVDLYVDGVPYRVDPDPVATPITYGATVRFEVVADKTTLDLLPAGSDPSAPPLASTTFNAKKGESYTAVAHYTPHGDLAVKAFKNQQTKTGPAKGRLVVRHLAWAAPVDVFLTRADGTDPGGEEATEEDQRPEEYRRKHLRNPKQKQWVLPAGDYRLRIVDTDSGIAWYDHGITVTAGEAQLLHFVGIAPGTFGFISQWLTLDP